MDTWDEEKLKEVVDKKHNDENLAKPKTDKVSGEWSSKRSIGNSVLSCKNVFIHCSQLHSFSND